MISVENLKKNIVPSSKYILIFISHVCASFLAQKKIIKNRCREVDRVLQQNKIMQKEQLHLMDLHFMAGGKCHPL